MGDLDRIILRHDLRGMARIAGLMPRDACVDAARLLLAQYQRVLLLTGFHVNGVIETDGPPGALAIAQAVADLGGHAIIVTDRFAEPILRCVVPAGLPIEEFPIAGAAESLAAARALGERLRPTLVMSIERCGTTRAGRYLNMRGSDITAYTARLDALLTLAPSIAIGDGGNEIGMGSVAALLTAELGIAEPCVTAADVLIPCAVSNWGAYGLVTALSRLTGKPLLPTATAQEALLTRLVAAGAVDGITGEAAPTVDGFDAVRQREILEELRAAVS